MTGWRPEARAAATRAARRAAIDRFWASVDRSGGAASCWTWLGKVSPAGYGRGGRFVGERVPHRAAYRLLVGPIPDGLTIDHLCRNTRCVNPAHLEPVTLAENIRRAAATKTHCPSGHPYDDANTYRTRSNHRACRTCHRMGEARRKRRLGARPARRRPPELIVEIHRLFAAGMSTYAIARRVGLNQGSVWRITRRVA